jgi:type I restriction enzyme S subunit
MIETDTKNDIAFAKKGYKQTKLGLIPEGWSTPIIAEVFEFLSTTSFSRNQLNYEEENDIFYIHYGDIHATYKTPILDFGRNKNVPKLNIDIILPATVQYLKDGDVIIADASEDYEGVGTAIELKNIGEKKVLSGLHTFALRDKDGLTVEGFRTYIFKNPFVKKALKTIATGSKVFGISKGNIQKFKIVLPPLPEQQKIASILSTWDNAIAAQEKLIAQKQALKKGLMQQLLTGKRRFPGFEEEWIKTELRDIGTIIRGASPRPKGDSRYYGGNVPRLMVKDVTRDGKYVTPKIDFLTEAGAIKSRPCKAGTLTIVCSGDVGVPSFLAVDACIHDGFLAIIDIKSNLIHSDFLYYQLKRLRTRMERSATHGGVFTNLTTTILKDFIIEIPPLKEQLLIINVLAKTDREVDKQEIKLEKIIRQKRGLMQMLLTGEKRVKI